ncbi:MAG TPA: DNA repair protein RadC [Rhabdochlamydiaceae bacterium]|nr:DNA repair protein RadC [Rhabdochlamydiaceae bacterium]
MTALRFVPEDERPRERLLKEGTDALAIFELLAILLGTGTKGKSVIQLAQEILIRFRGIDGLLDASIPELMEIKGIGKAKAILLKAAFGIARKASRKQLGLIESSIQAYEMVKNEISHYKQEVLIVILRDVRGRAIHQEKVSVGTLSEVLVHPREVFYPAVRYKAHSLIIAHNHPSGDPTPSNVDLELTRLLMHSSRVMGIGLDDHLIIGADSFVSLKEKGYLGDSKKY